MWTTESPVLNVSSPADVSASHYTMTPARLIATCSAVAYTLTGPLLSVAAAAAVAAECRRRRAVKPCDVYLFSILLSDFLQTSVFMSASVAGGVLKRDIFGQAGCVVLFWLHVTCHGATLLGHACLAGHWMILSLDSHGRAARKLGMRAAAAAASLTWIIVAVPSVGVAIDATYNDQPDYMCSHEFNSVTSYAYAAVSLIPSLTLAPVGYGVTLHRLRCATQAPSGFATEPGTVGAHGRDRCVENGGSCGARGPGVEVDDRAARQYERRIGHALVVAFATLATLFVSGIFIKSTLTDNDDADAAAEVLMHTMFLATSLAILLLSSEHRTALRNSLSELRCCNSRTTAAATDSG